MQKTLFTMLGLGLFSLAILSAHAETTDTTIKIAFVDTGNTGRSVTAEALANQIIQKHKLHIGIISRGIDIDPYDTLPQNNVQTILRQQGIDVSSHRAMQLTAQGVRHSDLILTMTQEHKDEIIKQYPEAKRKTFTITEYSTGVPGDVADAWGTSMPSYQKMVKQLKLAVPRALEKMYKGLCRSDCETAYLSSPYMSNED